MNKEKVIESLNSMGFELTEVENFGYVFTYDELNFLYMPDDDDDEFLRVALPNIFDVTDENRDAILETMEGVSETIKYAKTCIMYDTSVWAVYEHYLATTENLEDVLEHIVRVLQATALVFHKKINGEDIERPSEEDVDAEVDKALENYDDDEK